MERDAHLKSFCEALSTTSRILVVSDGRLHICSGDTEATDQAHRGHNFSLGPVLDYIEGFHFGPCRFSVQAVCRNDEPARAPTEEETLRLPECHDAQHPGRRFSELGFRFDGAGTCSKQIDSFDEIWMFGDLPGGSPLTDPNELSDCLDDLVRDPEFRPSSRAELLRLSGWMAHRDHGMFATGDHHILGASMNSLIPRVRTMRVWKVADGATTVGLDGRSYDKVETPLTLLNTVRPRLGETFITDRHESDDVAQPVKARIYAWALDNRALPHPLLSHPQFRLIDVLPDHVHSGICFDTDSEAWRMRHANARTVLFDDTEQNPDGIRKIYWHYPKYGNAQRLPIVAGDGSTLGMDSEPSVSFENGSQRSRSFPILVAYGGFAGNPASPANDATGPVVVDATFHHWLRLNQLGYFPQGVPTHEALHGVTSQKIARYWVNVATFLAPRRWRLAAIAYALETARFEPWAATLAETDMPQDVLDRCILHAAALVGESWLVHFAIEIIERIEPAFSIKLEQEQRECSLKIGSDVPRWHAILRLIVQQHFARTLACDEFPSAEDLLGVYCDAVAKTWLQPMRNHRQ